MGSTDAALPLLKSRRVQKMLSWLIAREAVSEVTTTRAYFEAAPETAWKRIMFYEEVSSYPPLLLRAVIPFPLRTESKKNEIGARIRCFYKGGDLVKQITAIKPPSLLQFEVVEQRLGIESCVVAQKGSYEIRAAGTGSEIALMTRYKTHLHPRWLWRPIEKLLIGQLHRHVLNGMRQDLTGEPRALEIPEDCAAS
jgi:hypothetical protein